MHSRTQSPNVPWCVRLSLAIKAVDLLQFIDMRHMMHCDWKYDQVAIDENWNVKIVDLKSLRTLVVGINGMYHDR